MPFLFGFHFLLSFFFSPICLSLSLSFSIPVPAFFSVVSSSNAVAAHDQGSQKPLHTTVVLLNSNNKNATSPQSVTTTTFFPPDSPVKPKPKAAFGAEWLSLLKGPVNIRRDDGTLKFSRSLNDMGQKMDSLCSGLHFIDRTCSDGELGSELEVPPECGGGGHAKACGPGKPTQLASAFRSPSFSTNYKFVGGPAPEQTLSAPPVPVPVPVDPQKSSNLLRVFFPFTHSSTAGSLHASELGSLASRLHITKSASALLEGSESFLAEEVGEDEVFEEEEEEAPLSAAQHWRLKVEGLRAPLCSLECDSDLDRCPSPLSDKTGPLSPFSLSGDCCRWVLGHPATCPHQADPPYHPAPLLSDLPLPPSDWCCSRTPCAALTPPALPLLLPTTPHPGRELQPKDYRMLPEETIY